MQTKTSQYVSALKKKKKKKAPTGAVLEPTFRYSEYITHTPPHQLHGPFLT